MNERRTAPARAEDQRQGRRSVRPRLGAVLTVLVVAALALSWTGCVPMFYFRDARCHGFTVEDPLLDIRFIVLTEPLRYGAVQDAADSLYLLVGHDGEAAMVREPKRRTLLRSRCRPLAADDLAEVMRAVERLERSAITERRIDRPGCRDITTIVLRGDPVLKNFTYCGTTPPTEVVRFIEEISKPLGRRFGEELGAGLAATAPWASPVPPDQPRAE